MGSEFSVAMVTDELAEALAVGSELADALVMDELAEALSLRI